MPDPDHPRRPRPLSRRDFLTASGAAAAAGLLAACDVAPLSGSGPAGARAPATASAGAPGAAATATPGPAASEATGSPAASASRAAPPAPRGPAVEITHGSRTTPYVALTFHASGRPGFTERMLAAAEEYSVRLTVLAVGTWLEAEPHMAARILDGGHELGNHTLRHLHMRELTAAQLDREIAGGADVLRRIVGTAGPWFRPSGTTRATRPILAAAGRAGYAHSLGFDIDPADWTEPGADVVTTRVLSQVQSGSIVSLHMDHEGTVQALPRILDGLVAKRLVAVPASLMLAVP